MITKRRMIVPIFDYKLTIVIFDDWEELKDYLPEGDFKVESAVNFWFKDNDYKGSNKVHDYFKEA